METQNNPLLIDFLKTQLPAVAAAYDTMTLESLEAAYAEPHRSYHSVTHIIDLLQKLQKFAEAGHADQPYLIAHAILWHDFVYTKGVADSINVEQSAQSFLASSVKLNTDEKGIVARMIRATDGHAMTVSAESVEANDMALFLDLDLSILAADAERYATYEKGVAFEYNQYPLAAFARGRADFLETYAKKNPLYFHPATAELYTGLATDNMRRAAIDWNKRAEALGMPKPAPQ